MGWKPIQLHPISGNNYDYFNKQFYVCITALLFLRWLQVSTAHLHFNNATSVTSVIKETNPCRTDLTCILNVISHNSLNRILHRTKRGVGNFSHGGQFRSKQTLIGSISVYKHPETHNKSSHVLPVRFNRSQRAPVFVETTTKSDKSLIRNSFFPVSHYGIRNYSTNTSDKNKISSANKSSAVDSKPSESHIKQFILSNSSERLRRSPYRLHNPIDQRAALHRLPARSIQPYHNRFHHLPPSAHSYSVPLSAPYAQSQSIDYSGYGSGYGYSSVPEEHYGNYNRIQRPPGPPPGGRRMPSSHRRRPPPGRHPPRHKSKPSHLGLPPQQPLYSYPKNAGNIQDILTYFKENEDQPPEHYDPLLRPPNRLPVSATGHQHSNSAFSKELDDVQSSLLKDIKEFAKRPTFMATEAPPEPKIRYSARPTYKAPNPTYQTQYHEDNSDSETPAPKPVREMAKNHQKHTYHEPRETQRQVHYRGKNAIGHHEDLSYEDNKDKYLERHKYRQQSTEKQLGSEEENRQRNRNRPSQNKYSTRHKYRDDWNSDEYEERDRSPSPSAYTPTNKPIVLKRPYGTYNPEIIDQDKRQRASYYNNHWEPSAEKDVYSSIPKVRPPSITYSPSTKSSGNKPNYYKNMSPEIVEDIVEIHTEPPYKIDTRQKEDREREKRAHLHKLYLEYLEQKLEAEKLALTTESPPIHKKHNPMRMKIHIYPNENVKTVDPSAVGTSYYYQPPTIGYSSNSSPYSRDKKYREQSYLGSHSHRVGVTGSSAYNEPSAQMGIDKNKNVVLHLHVHRRNGVATVSDGMHAEASQIRTSTTPPPLTYK